MYIEILDTSKLIFSLLPWPPDVCASFPDKERNLHKRVYVCFRQLDYFVHYRSRSHPESNLPFNGGDVPDIVHQVEEQFLRDVEQRLEDLEVGLPLNEHIVTVIFSEIHCFSHCC